VTDLNSDCWTGETKEITTLPDQFLSANRSVGTIHFKNRSTHRLDLRGNQLDFGLGGIFVNSRANVNIESGFITSSYGFLNINSKDARAYSLNINSSIVDSRFGRVSLSIKGEVGSTTNVRLHGNRSNTFTGETFIGNNGRLTLDKTGVATAISGSITVGNGGQLILKGSDQIADSSRVSLVSEGIRGAAPMLIFLGSGYSVSKETINELVVEGYGIFDFDKGTHHGSRYFYVDDLIIKNDSRLRITGWSDSRDRFLVRKNSKHIFDSIKRMEFSGYDPNRIRLVGFDKDYWEISALPESSAYGAILGMVGVGVFAWRKKRCEPQYLATAR